MSKNILVLTGSPRKHGNSDLMADAFIKGALAKGHQVTKFAAAGKKIGPCKACATCWSKGTACSFRDDFAELEPLLEKADTLVLATPLYWFTFSAQIKNPIDRLYSYVVPDCPKPLQIKEAILLICGGEGEKVFDGATASFQLILDFMKWQNKGMLVAPHVNAKGEILKTDFLEQAELLGSTLG